MVATVHMGRMVATEYLDGRKWERRFGFSATMIGFMTLLE